MSGPEVLIPITFFATIGAVFISRSEIGRALAHRIRGGSDVGDEVRTEVAELGEEVTELRHQLSETQERLDFNERMLAQSRAQVPLSRG